MASRRPGPGSVRGRRSGSGPCLRRARADPRAHSAGRDDAQLGDFIEDLSAPSPPDAVSVQSLKEQVGDVLGTLSERERTVLQLRFGLEDGRSRTLEEVGRVFAVTRERIRQIEAKALKKLRHPTRSRRLRDFLE